MKHDDAAVGYSKSASNNGRTTGTGVWCLIGTTLKGVRSAMQGWLVFPGHWSDTS